MRSDAQLLAHVDHTLLKPEATWPQVQRLCDEARQYHTASVCLNGCYVRQAAEYLDGEVPVCCVAGFPLGAASTAVKCFEAADAVENGAAEVDMVINVGRMKNGEYEAVGREIAAVKKAVGKRLLKVIIEACLLTDEEKERLCDIVPQSGADFIKTSTGFGAGGATFADVELFRRCIRGRCAIKAAGGISTRQDMERFLDLGAQRLGTSRAVRILTGDAAR